MKISRKPLSEEEKALKVALIKEKLKDHPKTAEVRDAISEGMKKRWAKRKKAERKEQRVEAAKRKEKRQQFLDSMASGNHSKPPQPITVNTSPKPFSPAKNPASFGDLDDLSLPPIPAPPPKNKADVEATPDPKAKAPAGLKSPSSPTKSVIEETLALIDLSDLGSSLVNVQDSPQQKKKTAMEEALDAIDLSDLPQIPPLLSKKKADIAPTPDPKAKAPAGLKPPPIK
jgi:hypothetical protein